jgi:hypothetical protein
MQGSCQKERGNLGQDFRDPDDAGSRFSVRTGELPAVFVTGKELEGRLSVSKLEKTDPGFLILDPG